MRTSRVLGALAVAVVVLLAGVQIGRSLPRDVVTEKPVMQVVAASLFAKLIQRSADAAGVKVAIRAEGSVAGARDVQLAPSAFGVFASVDPVVITSLVSPNVTRWYVSLAWDRMVIGYSPAASGAQQFQDLSLETQAAGDGNASAALSATAAELDLIFSGKSKIGMSNPDTDPEGYRALFMLELAGLQAYGDAQHYVSMLDSAKREGRVVTVDAGSKLFALVQSGAVDYDIALYESAAISAGIPYARASASVDLGDANMSAQYARASTVITSGGSQLTIHGAPIQLAVTIPRQAPDPDEAARLILHMVSPAGAADMRSLSVRPLFPARFWGNASDVPSSLRDWIGSGSIEVST